MAECEKKDSCKNYEKKCSECWAISSIHDTHPYYTSKDLVEVVRCKDCAHYIEMKGFDHNGRKARFCVWHSALRGENDYCSDAIRTSKRTPKERGGD